MAVFKMEEMEMMSLMRKRNEPGFMGGGGRINIGGFSKQPNTMYHSAVQPPKHLIQPPVEQSTAFQPPVNPQHPKSFDQKMRGNKHEQLDAIMSGAKYGPNPMSKKQQKATNNYAKNMGKMFQTTPNNIPAPGVTKAKLGKRKWLPGLFNRTAVSEKNRMEIRGRHISGSVDNLNVRDSLLNIRETLPSGPGYGEKEISYTDQGVRKTAIINVEPEEPSLHPTGIQTWTAGQDSWTKNPQGVRMSELKEESVRASLPQSGLMDKSLPPGLPPPIFGTTNLMDTGNPTNLPPPIQPTGGTAPRPLPRSVYKPKPLPRTVFRQELPYDFINEQGVAEKGIYYGPKKVTNTRTVRLDLDEFDPNLFSDALQHGSIDSDVFYTPPTSLQQEDNPFAPVPHEIPEVAPDHPINVILRTPETYDRPDPFEWRDNPKFIKHTLGENARHPPSSRIDDIPEIPTHQPGINQRIRDIPQTPTHQPGINQRIRDIPNVPTTTPGGGGGNPKKPPRKPPIKLNPDEESIEANRKKQIPYHEYPKPKPRTFSSYGRPNKNVTFGGVTEREFNPESAPHQKGPRPLPRSDIREKVFNEEEDMEVDILDSNLHNTTTRNTHESLDEHEQRLDEPMDTSDPADPVPFKKPKLSWMPELSKKEWLLLGGVGAAALGGATIMSLFHKDRERHRYF